MSILASPSSPRRLERATYRGLSHAHGRNEERIQTFEELLKAVDDRNGEEIGSKVQVLVADSYEIGAVAIKGLHKQAIILKKKAKVLFRQAKKMKKTKRQLREGLLSTAEKLEQVAETALQWEDRVKSGGNIFMAGEEADSIFQDAIAASLKASRKLSQARRREKKGNRVADDAERTLITLDESKPVRKAPVKSLRIENRSGEKPRDDLILFDESKAVGVVTQEAESESSSLDEVENEINALIKIIQLVLQDLHRSLDMIREVNQRTDNGALIPCERWIKELDETWRGLRKQLVLSMREMRRTITSAVRAKEQAAV